jgi:hypothetical protein
MRETVYMCLKGLRDDDDDGDNEEEEEEEEEDVRAYSRIAPAVQR